MPLVAPSASNTGVLDLTSNKLQAVCMERLVHQILDDRHFDFPGYHGPAYCRLRIWQINEGKKTSYVVLASDPGAGYEGTSLTNAAEAWGTAAWKQLGQPDLAQVEFFENYPHAETKDPETFDRVFFSTDGRALSSPSWQPSDRASVEQSVGGWFE